MIQIPKPLRKNSVRAVHRATNITLKSRNLEHKLKYLFTHRNWLSCVSCASSHCNIVPVGCIWLLMLWKETLCQSVLLSLVMGHLLTCIRLREDYSVTAGFHTVYNFSVPNTYVRVQTRTASPSDSLQTTVPSFSATASEDKWRPMYRERNKRFI
jgi:hypothetical protein